MSADYDYYCRSKWIVHEGDQQRRCLADFAILITLAPVGGMKW